MDTILQSAILFLTGIVAGIESGAFGVGGGSLMTPVQFWLYTLGGMDSTLAIRIAFGTSLAVILPTMISGALAHHRHKAVEWQAALPMGVAAIFGGLAGGIFASQVPGHVLRLFFAIFILIIAVRMFWHIRECAECEMRGSRIQFIVTGFFIFYLLGSYLISYLHIVAAVFASLAVSTGIMAYYCFLMGKDRVLLHIVLAGAGIFQWVFSTAFFFPEHTGFLITVASIIAFIGLMRATAGVDWERQIKKQLDRLGRQMALKITIQDENIFKAMHRI
mgnify:CR=1 FL=1